MATELKPPAIINFSYQVAPPLPQPRWLNDEARERVQGDIDRAEIILEYAYSGGYVIIKDEYIVQGDYTYHHIIAKRVISTIRENPFNRGDEIGDRKAAIKAELDVLKKELDILEYNTGGGG